MRPLSILMSDRAAQWLLSQFKVEAVFIPGTELVECSKRAALLLDRFGAAAIIAGIHRCLEDRTAPSITLTLPLAKPPNRDFREFRQSNDVSLKFWRVPGSTPDLKWIVCMEQLPPYDSIHARYECISYAVETLPVGVSLMRVDRTTGVTTGVFATRKYCELFNVDHQRFLELGVVAVTTHANPDDRAKNDPFVFESLRTLTDCSVTMRVLTPQQEYRWRQTLISQRVAPDGTVLGATTVADFEAGAASIVDTLMQRRCALILESLAQSVFDCCLYLDSKLRIATDTPAVRKWFARDPTKSIMGNPIELYLALDQSKLALRMYIESLRSEEKRPWDFTTLKIKMNIAGQQMVDVEVYASPMRWRSPGSDTATTDGMSSESHTITPFSAGSSGSRRTSTGAIEKSYLLAFKLTNPHAPQPPQPAPKLSAMGRQSVSPIAEESSVAESAGQKTPSSSSASPTSGSGASTVVRRSAIPLRAHLRSIYRDLARSMTTLNRQSSSGGETSLDWLIPFHQIASPEVKREELIRTLPNNLQPDFMEAANKGDFPNCAQLLAYSLEGNANILSTSPAREGRLVHDSDLIMCAYRFFISLLPLITSATRQFALLNALSDSRRLIIKRRMDPGSRVIILYQFALALITAAIRSPENFATESSVKWLRGTFSDALKAPDIPGEDPSRKLVVVYWICLLWGCLMNKIGRIEEAVAVLERAEDDLEQYCSRHPYSTMGRELQCMILHNLGVAMVEQGDLLKAEEWIGRLSAVTVCVGAQQVPPECYKLMSWFRKPCT